MSEQSMLARVADELAIRNLLARLALAADEGTPEAYATLYTDDAVWRMTPVPGAKQVFPARTGKKAIVAALVERRAANTGGPVTHTRHILFQSDVTIDGDSAQARSYFSYFVDLDTVPRVQLCGIYQDRFARTADGWKLRSRDIEAA